MYITLSIPLQNKALLCSDKMFLCSVCVFAYAALTKQTHSTQAEET